MFDSVGRVTSRSPRRLGPLLLSLLLNGGVIGAVSWLGARAIEEVEQVDAFLERPIELVLPSRGATGAPTDKAPAPASKPRPRAKASALAPVPSEVLPAPELVASLTPVEAPPFAPGAGASHGTVGSASSGEGSGVGGGGTGAGDGPGSGDGLTVVHWNEVSVKVRASVRPSDYPDAASALKLPDTRCVVRIHIDERGTPYEVVPRSCPEVFRGAAQNVALRYRFYPVRAGGKAVRAAFDLTIHFKGA